MLEIHNTQSQASSQFSSSSFVFIIDACIADEILDTCRGFRRDIGRKLSKSAYSIISALSNFPPPVPEDVQQYIHESQQYMTIAQQRKVATQEMITQQQWSIEAQAAQIMHIQRILSLLVSDVNMPLPLPLLPHFAHPPPTYQEDNSEEIEDEDLDL
ncbi:hypothetical protein PanWU01x14_298630 [Parasponia andersonii]|uniref:Uncharacterized protein n=1 Tax=Parasponia andersonii TaxID=3476 RepID=A0A2P5AUT0_PARAD|nr:hypothetical protein PanWU01x14_298630 [Parasponia andersonii]